MGKTNVSIERLGAQAKIRKKPLHSHDVAREADSIEIDLYLCIELYENVKISVLVAISLLQIELSLLKMTSLATSHECKEFLFTFGLST